MVPGKKMPGLDEKRQAALARLCEWAGELPRTSFIVGEFEVLHLAKNNPN